MMAFTRIRVLAPLAVAAGAFALGAAGSGAATRPGATSTPAAGRAATTAAAQGVRLAKVGSFNEPVDVAAAPGDRHRVFVVQKGGQIMVVRDGHKLATPFLDIHGAVGSSGSEQGLLSVAFSPDYATSRRFYVDFTDNSGDTRVVEYRAAGPNRADPASARQVLFQDQPEANHNGGLLLFGPDRLLYIGLGDGGGEGDRHGAHGNAQNLGTWLGKILRIDPRASGGRPYTVPASNPFVHRAGARGEIYAYGLRNPWRFSFDRRTGDMIIGDVGQDQREEIDFRRRGGAKGRNFGWRVYEGRARYTPGERAPHAVFPVIVRHHSAGYCSITSGVVVRDPNLPALRGRYLFGDLCKSRIESARLSQARARSQRVTGLRVPQVVSFGEDTRGRVYVVSFAGAVDRLAPKG